jgi:hypothetical protein
MFRPGRRLFSVAAILLIVVAGLHTMGHFAPAPDDPALLAVEASMKGYRLELPLGMHPSVRDVLSSLSLTMTVTLLLVGALDLLVARSALPSVRPFALANVVGVGALVALYWYHRISPPLVTLALVCLVFVLNLVLPERRRRSGELR